MQSRPGEDEKKKKKKKEGRPKPEDKKSMHPAQQSGGSGQSGPPAALLEAYKKHIEELRGIEDRQGKIVALVLGVLSAAGTLLIKEKVPLAGIPKVFVLAVAFAIVFIGRHAVHELHDMRIAARDLLVRCEIALRFYKHGVFLKEKPLYIDYELDYPTRGKWMKENYYIVWLVYVGFVLLLWQGQIALIGHFLLLCGKKIAAIF